MLEFNKGDKVRRTYKSLVEQGNTWPLGRTTVTVKNAGPNLLTFEEWTGPEIWYADNFEHEPVLKELTILRNKVPTELVPFLEHALKPGLAVLGHEIGYDIKVIVEEDVFRFSAQAK